MLDYPYKRLNEYLLDLLASLSPVADGEDLSLASTSSVDIYFDGNHVFSFHNGQSHEIPLPLDYHPALIEIAIDGTLAYRLDGNHVTVTNLPASPTHTPLENL